jgi:hypothetical protein
MPFMSQEESISSFNRTRSSCSADSLRSALNLHVRPQWRNIHLEKPMKSLLALFLLGMVASRALASETPCYREFGGVHIPALLNAAPSELQAQARCLILEYSVWPKAEFIPPAVQSRPTGPFRITVIEDESEHRETALSFGSSSHRPTLLGQPEKPALGLGTPATVLPPTP